MPTTGLLRITTCALLAYATACESSARACTAPLGPLEIPCDSPVIAGVDLQVDSVIPVGDTATATVLVIDSNGDVVSNTAIGWELRNGPDFGFAGQPGDVLRFDASTGQAVGHDIGRVWVIAKVGTLRDSTLVHVEQPWQGPIELTLAPLEAAPGATFLVSAWSGQAFLQPSREGRWFTSDSSVAVWSAGSPEQYARITMRASGRSTVGVEYWGHRASVDVVVRDPGPLTMDETGRCGTNAAGELWCKGSNSAGQLGTLTVTWYYRHSRQQESAVPVHGAPGMRFTAITSGAAHSCGISATDGRTYCWGLNTEPNSSTGYRLGGPSGTLHCPEDYRYLLYSCSFEPLAADRMLPDPLSFRTIKANDRLTCGITVSSEELWCWGDSSMPTRRDSLPAGWPAWP